VSLSSWTIGNIRAVSRLAERPFSAPRRPLPPHDRMPFRTTGMPTIDRSQATSFHVRP
jgi:hypothetical protein